MGMFMPSTPSIPTPPPVPEPVDLGRAKARSLEAMKKDESRRYGRGSTIVAGALSDTTTPTTGTPTLMG